MTFSIINFLNLMKDHLFNLNSFLWREVSCYSKVILFLDSKVKFAKKLTEKQIEETKNKGTRSIKTSRLYFEIKHAEAHRDNRRRFKEWNPKVKRPSFEKSRKEFQPSRKFKS